MKYIHGLVQKILFMQQLMKEKEYHCKEINYLIIQEEFLLQITLHIGMDIVVFTIKMVIMLILSQIQHI